VHAWHLLGERVRTHEAPDWVEELLIYQTLVGAWPIDMERLGAYLTKALREAKRNTSWVEPNEAWENEVISFTRRLCSDGDFRRAFEPVAEWLALAGERISLAEVALRLTAPGVPDIYQGDELWTYSLVDPDNRRPVDWERATDLLGGWRRGGTPTRASAKLVLVATLLELRVRQFDAFAGRYLALDSSPSTCAFQRGDDVVVAVALGAPAIDFELPAGAWHDVLDGVHLPYSPAPVAIYERVTGGAT
jgi:(1->4)-alpha-D-glucan 1-alpha-D-glucosylmutase